MNLDAALGIHPQALELRSRRSEVLASNLANADTPGYKARDFDLQGLLRNETPDPHLTVTQPDHIQPGQGVVPPSQMQYREPMQASLDGNTVDTELEYSNFAANAMEYQASLSFLDARIKTLMLAIRGE
jgi:flagellar basal-body rod protein FlgB